MEKGYAELHLLFYTSVNREFLSRDSWRRQLQNIDNYFKIFFFNDRRQCTLFIFFFFNFSITELADQKEL